MATRRLARVPGLDPQLVERLERSKICTCQDVLSRTPFEVMEVADLGEPLLSQLYAAVAEAVVPDSTTVLDLYRSSHEQRRYLSTQLPSLDRVLLGGLLRATITEVVGPSGAGKTQFCLQASVTAALPPELNGLGCSVLYIDTEGAFRPDRLLQIAEHRTQGVDGAKAIVERVGQRVKVLRVDTNKELLLRLQQAEELIIKEQVGLVVVDSVASLARKEFDGRGGVRDRSDVLAQHAAQLKYLAASFDLPVIVSNHITTRFDPASEDAGVVTAALGNTWSHSVNTRLVIEYAPQASRVLRIAKSPVAPFCSVKCCIDGSGLVESGPLLLSGTAEERRADTAIAVRTAFHDQDASFGYGRLEDL